MQKNTSQSYRVLNIDEVDEVSGAAFPIVLAVAVKAAPYIAAAVVGYSIWKAFDR